MVGYFGSYVWMQRDISFHIRKFMHGWLWRFWINSFKLWVLSWVCMESHYLILPLLWLLFFFVLWTTHFNMWFVFCFGWFHFRHSRSPLRCWLYYFFCFCFWVPFILCDSKQYYYVIACTFWMCFSFGCSFNIRTWNRHDSTSDS